MLFSKDVPARCVWCKNASPLSGEQVLCRLKGPVEAAGCCRRYASDPYKRIPAPRPSVKKPPDEDYSLD